MSDVFRHAGWAFGQVYENLRALAIDGNFLWFVTVFPLIPIVGIPASSALERAILQVEGPVNAIQFFVIIVVGTGLTGFLAGPGTAGLFHVAQRHLDGEDARIRDFLHGFRTHFMRAWFLFIIDMFLLYGLVMGFIFYTGTGILLIQGLGFLSLYFVLLWVASQAYLFPLALHYDMSPYHAFRNAVVLALSAPGPSIAFFLLVLICTASTLLLFPIVFFTAITLALVGLRMTQERLTSFGVEPPQTHQ